MSYYCGYKSRLHSQISHNQSLNYYLVEVDTPKVWMTQQRTTQRKRTVDWPVCVILHMWANKFVWIQQSACRFHTSIFQTGSLLPSTARRQTPNRLPVTDSRRYMTLRNSINLHHCVFCALRHEITISWPNVCHDLQLTGGLSDYETKWMKYMGDRLWNRGNPLVHYTGHRASLGINLTS